LLANERPQPDSGKNIDAEGRDSGAEADVEGRDSGAETDADTDGKLR
jgi:hypothetical protein